MATNKGARLLSDPAFPVLKEKAIALTGLSYWSDKDGPLADLLVQLLERLRVPAGALARRLTQEDGQGGATQALVDAVTVGETFFFRYREQFEALEQVVIPDLIERNRPLRTLSVWSAGCSNGAEAYSLSILLNRRFAVPLAGWEVAILGTDINASALAEANAALYGDWSVRDLSEDVLHECFTPQGGRWRVKPAYRQGVRFAPHNLATQPPPGRFDLVLCRNVLMYFDGETRDRVLLSLREALVESGWLLLGHAETQPAVAEVFAPLVLPDCTLYRRKAAQKPKPAPVRPPAARPPVARPPAAPAAKAPPSAEMWDLEACVRRLLDRGEFSVAATRCRAWADAHPLDPAPHYFLGLALEHLSEDLAIAAFRRALFLAPNLALAHFSLLRLFVRRGEYGPARRHYVSMMADLAGLPIHQPLPLGMDLTVGELAAAARRLGPSP
ncbi:MAG: protein-glutamate O-methyltransferase CheR [Magnetospirillum sp.]|nr:protein-glutamate O-methyltransferase CheR [Magnetospirillum sp.]